MRKIKRKVQQKERLDLYSLFRMDMKDTMKNVLNKMINKK